MIHRLKAVSAALAPAALLAACTTVPPSGPTSTPVEIGIVAINDFHGQLEPPNMAIAAPDGAGGTVQVPAGGAAWFASAVDAIRARHPNTLTVAAGDLTSASQLSSSLFLDEPTVNVMNRIGLEYTALGNHEFDRGVTELKRLQQGGCAKNTTREPCAVEPDFPGAQYQYLAANVTDAGGNTLFPATALKRFGSGANEVTVGIVGLPLKDVPALVSPAGLTGWSFGDEAEAINRATEQLKRDGADVVVVLIHQGLTTELVGDPDSCEQATDLLVPILDRIDPRVDVVVSGHTHWAYVCEWPASDGAEPILVTSTGRYGTMLTDITLRVDPASGRVIDKSAHNVIVQSVPFRDVALTTAVPQFAPRQDIAQYVQQYVDAAAALSTQPVGKLDGPAREGPAPFGGPLGNLVADSQLAATREAGAQFALMNPGGLRADILPAADGTVTFGDIYKTQPFNNTLTTMRLSGAELKALLEQQFDSEGPEQVLSPSAGFTFAFDRSRPVGQRILEMTLDGRPIDPAADYRLTVNSFLAAGGDFFTVFKEGRDVNVGGPPDIEAFEAWIKPGRAVPQEVRTIDRTPATP